MSFDSKTIKIQASAEVFEEGVRYCIRDDIGTSIGLTIRTLLNESLTMKATGAKGARMSRYSLTIVSPNSKILFRRIAVLEEFKHDCKEVVLGSVLLR